MHLRAHAPRAFTRLSFGTEATYPNVIILSKIRQCRGFLPSRRIRCATKAIATDALTPAIRCTSPPYSKHSNRGVKHYLGVNNQLLRMRRFAKETQLFAPVETIGLSPQKRKLPVSSCSVRSTKSRHRYFEDLRLWRVHNPVSCIRAYHLVIERPSSSKSW